VDWNNPEVALTECTPEKPGDLLTINIEKTLAAEAAAAERERIRKEEEENEKRGTVVRKGNQKIQRGSSNYLKEDQPTNERQGGDRDKKEE